ncbi:MAG TPA: hypothetical protein PLD47_03450 [Aggregatilineales bacterium]|nr:hypothetical protein [Anaerolineales bacterium]HRE46755.1 hypothetical protein [Aggregatilineales bacterium]
MKDWSRITEYLNLLLHNTRYAPYVMALLKVIPLLQNAPMFADIEPGLTHLTLTLSPHNTSQRVHLDFEGAGYYNIYLDRPEISNLGVETYRDHVTVPFEAVIATLQTYLQRLREVRAAV